MDAEARLARMEADADEVRSRRRGVRVGELEAHRGRHDSCRDAPGLYDSRAPPYPSNQEMRPECRRP